MKKNRTDDEWRTYIAEHTASGLTVKQFCKEKGSCPSHFSERKRVLSGLGKDNEAGSVFVRVQPKEQKPVARLPAVVLCIQHREMLFSFEQLPGSAWLAQLLRALA